MKNKEGFYLWQASHGRSMDELKELLEIINESIDEEMMLNDGDTVNVSISKTNSGYSWVMNQMSAMNKISRRRFGESMDSLLTAIDGQVEDITEEFADWSLLVYRGDMEPFMASDGKSQAMFWELLPGDSLHVKNGQPFFHEKKIRAKEESLKLLADSGIIFRKEDVYYIISEDALPQIGGILDCSSIMRKKNTETGYLLGLALLMSDKLDEANGLRFKTIEIGPKIRMIISCFSKTRDAGKSSMQKVLEDSMEYLKMYFGDEVKMNRWEMDEKFTMKVQFDTKITPDYSLGVEISCGEARGVPVRVKTYASFEGMQITLLEHSGQKGSRTGNLFNGIVSAMEDFEQTWKEVEQQSIICTEKLFGKMSSPDCLGSKRSKVLMKMLGRQYLTRALFLEVLNATYDDLPEKQMRNLQAEYWVFLKNCLYAARAKTTA